MSCQVPSGIKLPNFNCESTEFHHIFFGPHLLASLKAIECSTSPSDRTNISKLNFASGRTGRTAVPSSGTLVKLLLKTITIVIKKYYCKI